MIRMCPYIVGYCHICRMKLSAWLRQTRGGAVCPGVMPISGQDQPIAVSQRLSWRVCMPGLRTFGATLCTNSHPKLPVSLPRLALRDLNVRGMMANRSHPLVVSDVGMFEFRRQLEYKAAMRGCQVRLADRFFPSSKRCNPCGLVNRDLGREPEWRCPNCGVLHDRDPNASWNRGLMAVAAPLLRETVPHSDMCGRAESSLAAASLPVTPGSSVTVCGAEGSDGLLTPVVKPSAGKQKPEQVTFVYV